MKWVIFENTQNLSDEASVDSCKAGAAATDRDKDGRNGMLSSGMMYRADCGSNLNQCRATGFRKDQEYYICPGYRKGKQVRNTPTPSERLSRI